MTLGAWLRDRTPAPLPQLRARIEHTLGDRAACDASEATEECVSAAERLLAELLARPTAGRETALDLLAVDALVTYAFEAAADDPDSLPERARDAMARLAAVVRR